MIRRIFADFLQPALIYVLQHRVGVAVRGFGTLHAVEPDHDAVQSLALHDGVTDPYLEILEFCPQVQLCVGQHRIKVGLFAFVFHVCHYCRVSWFALFCGGIRSTGNRATDTQTQQLA
ncbi:Uncharacterised protein [Klebsiella pneumoniae]|nr:Uncharacterised protein [Klebsiella pneumoniae]